MIPKKIFIIPYRNREHHKLHFSVYMKYILEDIQEDEYKIYYVHQCDNRSFNRGAIKNIGFLAIKALYPNDYKNITFIFNDIDVTPVKKNLLNYDTTEGIVKHFYGFTHALGGIFSITGADFEKTGGFPNFWGWGLEDNCIQDRVLNAQLNIDRTIFYKVGDSNIIHLFDDIKRVLSKQDAWRYKLDPDTLNDINNLEYTIENEFIQVKHFATKYAYKDNNFYTKNIITDNVNKIVADNNYAPNKRTSYPKKSYNLQMFY